MQQESVTERRAAQQARRAYLTGACSSPPPPAPAAAPLLLSAAARAAAACCRLVCCRGSKARRWGALRSATHVGPRVAGWAAAQAQRQHRSCCIIARRSVCELLAVGGRLARREREAEGWQGSQNARWIGTMAVIFRRGNVASRLANPAKRPQHYIGRNTCSTQHMCWLSPLHARRSYAAEFV